MFVFYPIGQINFFKDCKIRMYATVFHGRRVNGTTNSAYLSVIVDDSVVYFSSAITNMVGSIVLVEEYDIKSGSNM